MLFVCNRFEYVAILSLPYRILVYRFVHRYTDGLHTVYILLYTMQRTTSANGLLSPLKDFQSETEVDFKKYDQIVKTKDKIENF